jgi:hypothetical protein
MFAGDDFNRRIFHPSSRAVCPGATPSEIPAIEIAAFEPLAGRLPAQARTRVRAGGRPAAMFAGDDFNRRIFHPSSRAVCPGATPSEIPAIEIAAFEPLAGRLPAQARTRVRAGGHPTAMFAGDDFNRRIFSSIARARVPMSNSYGIRAR